MSLYDKAYAPERPSGVTRDGAEGEFSKGLRGSVAGMGAQLRAFGNSGMRAAGLDVSAESDAAVQQSLAEAQAAEQAAMNPTWDSVHDLRGGANWAAYKAGGLLPALAGGLGAGIVGGATKGKVGAIAAPTALFTPLEAGDISLRQMQDPQAQQMGAGEQFGRALGGGLISSAAQNVVPGMMASRMMGAGAAEAAKRTFGQSVAHNMGEGIVGQGLAGAGAEGIRQVAANPQAPLDMHAIGEAGFDNAVLGAGFGAAGVAGDMAHGLPRKAINGVKGAYGDAKTAATGLMGDAKTAAADAAKTPLAQDAGLTIDKVGAAVGAAKDAVVDKYDQTFKDKSPAQHAVDFFTGAKKKADKGWDHMIKGGFFGNPEEMRTASPERAGELATASSAEAERRAQAALDEMMGEGTATPEMDPATREGQVAIATASKDRDFLSALRAKASSFHKGVSEAYDKSFGSKDGAKKSEDFSGVHEAITKELLPSLDENTRKALVSDPETQTKVVSGIRQWIALAGEEGSMPKGKDGRPDNMEAFKHKIQMQRQHDRLVELLGSGSGDALHRIYDTVRGKDGDEIDRVFGHVRAIHQTAENYKGIQDALVKMLPRKSEHWEVMQDPDATSALLNWARGSEGVKTQEDALYNDQMKRTIQAMYGKKAGSVLDLLESQVRKENGRPDNAGVRTDRETGETTTTTAHDTINKEDEQTLAAREAREGVERADAERADSAEERYHKTEDGKIRELFVGHADREGVQSVTPFEGGEGIAGLMEHPDVQKGKFASAPSYTEHIRTRMEKARPNHKWEFVSMREHAKREGKDTASMAEQFPDLREVPEHEWDTYGYLRGVNAKDGNGNMFIGKSDTPTSMNKSPEKLKGLFRSPAHEAVHGADAQSGTETKMRDLRNKYPGYNVSFVTMKEYMKSTGKTFEEARAHFNEMDADESKAGEMGYIKLQGKDRDEEGLAPYELRRVMLDTKNRGRSPSRISIGESSFDAVALTREFSKKMGYDRTSGEAGSDLHRIKEAFLNGYAAILDHAGVESGAGPEGGRKVPGAKKGEKTSMLGDLNPDLVIAYRSGRKITVGDIMGDLPSRFKEGKLPAHLEKMAQHLGDMEPGKVRDMHEAAWLGEEEAKSNLHEAGKIALEDSGFDGPEYNRRLAEWKNEHRDDPEFRLTERENWTNTLQRHMQKDNSYRAHVLGNERAVPNRDGEMRAGRREDTPNSEQDRNVRTASLSHDIAERERLIAEQEKFIANTGSETGRLTTIQKSMIAGARKRIQELTDGKRMFPDKKGNLPIKDGEQPMASIAELKARLAHAKGENDSAPVATQLKAAAAKTRLRIEDLERQMFDAGPGDKQNEIIRQLDKAHDELKGIMQDRIHRGGDVYGAGGTGRREVDPFTDIHTAEALLSKDDLSRHTNMDGSHHSDRTAVKNDNVHDHNTAIAETQAQIADARRRMNNIKAAEKRAEKSGMDYEGDPVEAANLEERIKTLQADKDRMVVQNGMLTEKGHAAFQETFAKRMDTAVSEWHVNSGTPKQGADAKLAAAAPKLAIMRRLVERSTKLATYADRLTNVERTRLMDFMYHKDKLLSPLDAERNLTTLIGTAKDAIRKKDYEESKTAPPKPEVAAPKAEGTPDPKAVAAKKAAFLEKAASGDKGLIKELSESNDVKGLQRAVDALNGQLATPELVRVLDAANDRIAELRKDPDVAYGMLTKKYSLDATRVDPNATGPKTTSHKDLLDQLHKTLGNTVELAMANIMHAGEFSREAMGDIIRLSVHSLNPMSTLHHESLHAFFQQLRDRGLPEIANVVERMASSPHVMAQLRERLKHSPEALRQLRDPEEAAAYAYQFWAMDKTFKLQPEHKNVFQKVADFFRDIMGIWTNDQRAEHILKYFNSGEYAKTKSSNAINAALMNVGKNHSVETLKSIATPLINLRDTLAATGQERLHDTGNSAIIQIANLIKARGTDQARDAGYLPNARVAASTHMNTLAKSLDGMTESHIQEAFEAMQRGEDAGSTEAKAAQAQIKKFLRGMRDDYLVPAGVKMGDMGENYIPHVYDPYYISTHQDEFQAVLAKYGVNEETMHKIIAGDGVVEGVEIDKPGLQFRKERKLSFIPDAELAPFMKKDFFGTMSQYVNQSTKRAEWARRFNDDSSGLHDLMEKAKEQGATKDQLDLAEEYIKGVNGRLGETMSADARRLQSNMMVYQNVRLLPLMLFSSMVDPLGIAVRGGKLGDVWNAYKRGAKELHKAWQNNPEFDAATEMATTMGIIDNANLGHTMGVTFGGGMSGGSADKINNTFFKYNFGEQVNQSMRVSAMEAAKRFIVRHVDQPGLHSERYLRELGLLAKDVKKDANGELLMDPNDAKIKMALNRWVDGAVLRPDSADKPIWMNDPHFALIGHLKQFAFAFQSTILGRIMHEANHGNFAPMLAAASYVPVMFAADAMKSILTSGSVEPDWKNGWSLMDHIGYETQRAGLLGVGQFSVDAMNDVKEGGTGIGRLLGPTVEQLTEVAQVVGGRKQFGSVALHSMPANALYSNWVNSSDRVKEVASD